MKPNRNIVMNYIKEVNLVCSCDVKVKTCSSLTEK